MREMGAVIVGAIVGTALRLGFDTFVHHTDSEFPVSTLVINLLGSFALALLVARVWPHAKPWLKAGLGAGLLGSFTTFSAFAASLVTLASAHELGLAVLYLVVSLVGGLAAAYGGLALGARLHARVVPVNE